MAPLPCTVPDAARLDAMALDLIRQLVACERPSTRLALARALRAHGIVEGMQQATEHLAQQKARAADPFGLLIDKQPEQLGEIPDADHPLTQTIRCAIDAQKIGLPQERTVELMEQRGLGIEAEEHRS